MISFSCSIMKQHTETASQRTAYTHKKRPQAVLFRCILWGWERCRPLSVDLERGGLRGEGPLAAPRSRWLLSPEALIRQLLVFKTRDLRMRLS